MAYLDDTGLAYFWGKIKAWANSAFSLLGHTHPSSDVTLMTGYSKPASSSAISASDSLNQAIGKLEKGAEAADGNAVHKTGTETVGGQKTFTGPYDRPGSSTAPLMSGMIIRNLEAERGVVPDSNRYWTIACCDAAGSEWDESSSHSDHGRLGVFEIYQGNGASGVDQVRGVIAVYKNVANDGSQATLSIGYDANGIAYASAPPTSASRASGNDIVTRSWLSNSAANLVHRTGDESIAGTKAFTDEVVVENDVSSGTQIRLKRPTHSLIVRTDSSSYESGGDPLGFSYFLLTDEGDPDGSWNTLRPISIRHGDGAVFIENRRSVIQYNGNLHIYISKNGDDGNDGLTSSTPVATMDGAASVASRFNVNGILLLRFGPGNWGTVYVRGGKFSANFIRIANYTLNQITTIAAYNALTGNSEPPYFEKLILSDSHFQLASTKIDSIELSNGNLELPYTNSFGGVNATHSVCNFSVPYIVHSTSAVSHVFLLNSSRMYHGGVASAFNGSISRSYFIQTTGASTVWLTSTASWTGTFTGTKLGTDGLADIAGGSLPLADWPGSGWTGNYSFGSQMALRSGAPSFMFVHPGSTKTANPSSTLYWTLAAASIDNATSPTLANNIAYIEATQTSGGENTVALVAVKPLSTTLATQAKLVYNANGSTYFILQQKLMFSDPSCQITGPTNSSNSLQLFSANHTERGACMWLYGPNHSTYEGALRMRAADSSGTYKDFMIWPNGRLYWNGMEYHGNGSDTQYARLNGGSTYQNGARLLVTGKSMANYSGAFHLTAQSTSASANLIGTAAGSLTWKGQTIQTTSDERKKDFISAIPDDVLDAWEAVEWSRFKYRDDIAEKGEDRCRWHSGLVAQRVEKACADAGVDILAYGMLCHDRSPLDVDTDEFDDLWTMRYEEALCMEAAYQRRRADRAEARIAALEDRLAALELRLGSE